MDDDYSMPTTEASQTDESQEITQTEGLIEVGDALLAQTALLSL